MKYCTKCGAKLIEGAKFCTICGNRIDQTAPAQNVQTTYVKEPPVSAAYQAESQPARQPEKKKVRWGFLAAVFAAVLIIGAAAVLIPKLTFNAPKKFVEMHRGIISPVIDYSAQAITRDLNSKTSEKIKEYSCINTDFTVSVDMETGSDYIDEILSGSSVTFKVNSENTEKPLYGFVLNLNGSEILSGTIVTEKDRIGIDLSVLSDDYYQIRYEDLGEILTVLGLDSDYDVQTIVAALHSGESPIGVDRDQLVSIIDSYLDVFFSMVKKENTTYSKEEVLLPGCGEYVKCTVITFTPTADDVTEMMEQFCLKLENDKEVREIVGNAAAYSYMASPELAYYYDDSDEYVEFILDTYDEKVSNLWNENKSDIKAFAEKIEKNGICWKIAYKALRIHMISITDKAYSGFGYESAGNILDQRTDMIVRYENGNAERLADNKLKLSGKNATGSLNVYELDYGTAKLSYSINIAGRSGLKVPYGEISFRYGDYRIDVDVDRKDSGSQHDIALKNDEHDIKIGIFSTDKDSTAIEPEKTPVRVTSDNIMTVIRGMRGKIMEIFWNIYG